MRDMGGTSELKNRAECSFQLVQIPGPNKIHNSKLIYDNSLIGTIQISMFIKLLGFEFQLIATRIKIFYQSTRIVPWNHFCLSQNHFPQKLKVFLASVLQV